MALYFYYNDEQQETEWNIQDGESNLPDVYADGVMHIVANGPEAELVQKICPHLFPIKRGVSIGFSDNISMATIISALKTYFETKDFLRRPEEFSFISAQEARGAVVKTHNSLLVSFKQDIDKKIRQAVGEGETCIEVTDIPAHISSELLGFLNEKGFRVDVACPPSYEQNDNPPSKFRISW